MPERVDVVQHFIGTASPVTRRAGAGGHPCQGIYCHLSGHRPTTAFIACHYNVDFSEHYLAAPLARRGFGFLGWNTRFRGNEAYFLLDHALVEIGVGVRWLREEAGVERIVMLGNSGGGSLMAAYQAHAKQGTVHPTPGRRVPAGFDALEPGDLIVFLAAHLGRPDALTNWLDPSLTSELDPLSCDPALDMYNPSNGPPYRPDFVDVYRSAQRDRNHRITAFARSELARCKDAGASDRLFVVPRTWADLRFTDATIDPSNRPVPACYLGDPRRANYGVFGIGVLTTCRTWLSMWSLEHSQCRVDDHLRHIGEPTLVVQPDADSGVFPSEAEHIYATSAAADKEMVVVAGDHYFQTPASSRDALAETVGAWVEARS